MKEREISLVDLLIEILLHWRAIILWMLIGGIAFGALSYVKSSRSAQAQRAQLEEEQRLLDEKRSQQDLEEEGYIDKQWLEEQLTETQIANVNTVVSYEKIYADKLKYVKESAIMKMDPNAVPETQLTFLIKAEDTQLAYDIQKVYEDLTGSAGMYNWLAEQCGISAACASELVTLERSSYSLLEGSNLLRLAVAHNDEQVCQKMAEAVIEYLVGQSEALAPVLGEHELVLLDQSFAVIVDTNVLASQRNYYTDLASLRAVPVNAKEIFSDEEWKYYNFITTGNIAGDIEDRDLEGAYSEEDATNLLGRQAIPSPGVSVKYIVAGIVMAVLLYALVICMAYIFSNRLKTGDDLQSLYDIPQLGRICREQNSRKFLAFVDKWILSLRDRKIRRFAAGEAVNLAAVAVKMAVKKEGFQSVYLIGCNMKNGAKTLCEQIKEILKDEDISISVLDNVLYDAEAMDRLSGAECVALVESAGSTLYGEIDRELELLRRQEIKILGGIVVE